ncbi:MAG: hypothetical protein A2138_07985 [Deltaproteobacteria bacterium RBG_16_71_12]|nr:MAG: hypothetical protein A2138_07985 [Deltaproteobacteria bacterium RBG_16_71_12]
MRRSLVVLLGLGLTGCGGDLAPRLQKPLDGQGIKDVAVDDSKITAVCAQGDKVEVPVAELELNFLGMAKTEQIAAVVKKIVTTCEEKDAEKKRIAGIREAQGAKARELGIDIAGKDDEAVRGAICEKLTSMLPVKEPDRTRFAEANERSWKCPPAPKVDELPTGRWQIEIASVAGPKRGPSFLRLENDDGTKLTYRCASAKLDVYVQPAAPAKKGTRVVDAKLDGGKAAKWKVKPSTDGKALFLVDAKAVAKAMASAARVTLAVPGAKGSTAVTFEIKGVGQAQKQLPKGCK